MSFLYQKNTLKIFLFFATLLLQGCAFIGSTLVPLESIEPPSGKYGVGTKVYYWTDELRGEVYTTDPGDFRSLMVQIWYPAAKNGEPYLEAPHITNPKQAIDSIAKTAGLPSRLGAHGTRLTSNSSFNLSPKKGERFPLILYSHGDGGLLNQNTSQVEELVSNGFIVIACNHTYNASITFDKKGNAIPYKQNVSWNEQAQYHKKYYTNLLINYRYKDLVFLMNQLTEDTFQNGEKNLFKSIIDFEKIGAFGHSMGGGTIYTAMLKNKKIKAGVALDGWFFGLLDGESTQDTNKPFLHIAQEQFVDEAVFGDINDSVDGKKNYNIHKSMLSSNKESYGVYIKNSLHYSFTDLKLIYKQEAPMAIPLRNLGTVDRKLMDKVMDKIILDFFNYTLKGEEFNIYDYNSYNNQVIYIRHN